MSVFRFPCSHNASITDTASFGYLNPSSKASGIAVALFKKKGAVQNQYPYLYVDFVTPSFYAQLFYSF